MELINIDQDILYTYYDQKEKAYKTHTGTIREFLNAFCDTGFLYIYTFDYKRISENEKKR